MARHCGPKRPLQKLASVRKTLARFWEPCDVTSLSLSLFLSWTERSHRDDVDAPPGTRIYIYNLAQ